MNTNWWLLSAQEVYKRLSTDPELGLSENEARKRLEKYGPNVLAQAAPVSAVRIFFRQFFNVIVLILIASCIIAGILGSWFDTIVIGAIVILNAVIGFFQEYGAERSLEALRKLTKPQVEVIRDGFIKELPSSELVPGDIVELLTGDVIPADGRLVESVNLSADESALTGESVPVAKNDALLPKGEYPVADQANMAFMGTIVVNGRAKLVVTSTGADTIFGKIAAYIARADEPETQLHKQLKKVGYVLIATSCFIAAALTAMGLMHGVPLGILLFTSLSLFIAAVPEGLPAVITVALARAVKRMAKRHALIRRLASVESLGSISVICTDKTGTLTQNRMTVTQIMAGGTRYQVTGTGVAPLGKFLKEGIEVDPQKEPDLYKALEIGLLCNGAELERTNGEWYVHGDPTEGALLAAAGKAGLTLKELEKKYPLVVEYSFDTQRKRMGMLRKGPSGCRLYVKGAFDSLIDCSSQLLSKGKVVPLTDEHRAQLDSLNDQYAAQALRVIAVAYKDGPEESFAKNSNDEKDLIFVGLFAMIDPPRPEVRKAIHEAQHAGIKTIMLTGDHKETARAIGVAVGLMEKDDKAITGKEIDTLSDEELIKALYTTPVCARISVEHKIRIVDALKKAGERVAMTGDGVNDAPALKAADIGIAMGITGTDVAKEAADMIITDDNYASIVSAIKEGRGMYESLVKFVRYLLSSNLAEILVLLWGGLFTFTSVAGQPLVALMPVQLLWVNLISDGLPAIALVFDPLHKGLMRKSPSEFRVSLVAPHSLAHLAGVGLILSFGVMGSYFMGLTYSAQIGQTMAFTTLVLLEFVRLASVRQEFNLPFFSNPLVILAAVVSILLQLLLIYVPTLQVVFHTVPLSALHWLYMLISVILTWIGYKIFQRYFP